MGTFAPWIPPLTAMLAFVVLSLISLVNIGLYSWLYYIAETLSSRLPSVRSLCLHTLPRRECR
jgi:hypothetical protein